MLVGLLVSHSITFAQNLDATKAGVVKITTTTGQTGTGFIVRIELEVVYIITAAHVIAGDNQPKVEFFTKRNVPVTGAVLPGAEVNDDLRGLALVVVREKVNIPAGVMALAFGTSADLVSGGEEVVVIGHPGGGGSWAVLKRNISNRVGRDLSLDPGVASRFSGGPIMVKNNVVGIMMSNQDGFAKGITHKSVLNYMEGFGVVPSSSPIVRETPPSLNPRPTLPTVRHAVQQAVPSKPLLLPTKKGKDGAPMVLVAQGEFMMGSQIGEGSLDETPQHTVELDAYYIDQYEVTVERYQRFMEDQSHRQPEYWDQVMMRRDAQKPVVGIDWHDAKAYCAWARKRLPTEAEWEKAARGTDKQIYPWGDSKPNSSTANFGKAYEPEKTYAAKLKAVGSYERGKSPYEADDMAGNVWEWVADWYSSQDYYGRSPKKNPKGPLSGDGKVLRGGSWNDFPSYIRSALRNRNTPTTRSAYFGVRCAQDVPSTLPLVEESKSASPAKPITPTAEVELPSSVPNHQLSQAKTGKDGSLMVFVPEGEFIMGSFEGEGDNDEHPQQEVYLKDFYIDQYEVTVERFQRFMKEKNRSAPEYWDQVELRRDAQKPVVGIDWNDAKAYCEWGGKRLPTEAEWEKAARGTDKRTYPWGNDSSNSSTANFGKDWNSDVVYSEKLMATESYERGKSPYGAYDMAGNVWEWVADWYDKDYYQVSPEKNPKGPSSGDLKVLRGGSWRDNTEKLRSAERSWGIPTTRYAALGVRCAQDAP